MPSLLAAWREIQRSLQASEPLGDPSYANGLDCFHDELVATCGEDPTILRTCGAPVHSEDDITNLSLSNYLGWCLTARHATLYQAQDQAPFRPLAFFGRQPGLIRPDGVLVPWVLDHGVLVRSQLRFANCSAEEAECLVHELDALDAEFVVPIGANEGLWGLIVVGTSLIESYDGSECLYLGLYGWALLRARNRCRLGEPTQSQRRDQEESQTMQDLLELWQALKPPEPIRLMLLDEEPKFVESLYQTFSKWGFAVTGVSSEAAALKVLAEFRPQLILVDLRLRQHFPIYLLGAARVVVPESILVGTTTVRDDAMENRARVLGVRRILRKPCRLPYLVNAFLQAALELSLGSRAGAALAFPAWHRLRQTSARRAELEAK